MKARLLINFFVLFASSLLFTNCGVIVRTVASGIEDVSSWFYPGRHGGLTDQEILWAKIAWKYFENNRSSNTGLINSADRYPASSMWNAADYLAALVAAYELKLIDTYEFDKRLSAILSFLGWMSLFGDQVPHKLYDTKTGQKITYSNKPGEIGYSGTEIGRLLIWLKIVRDMYPSYSEYVDKAVLRWNFCYLLDSLGNIYGGSKSDDKIIKYREGKLGEEEYAARGYQSWGFKTDLASKIEPFNKIKIYDYYIHFDARDTRLTGGHTYVESIPYILDGLEFQWGSAGSEDMLDYVTIDSRYYHLAQDMFRVQRTRYEEEKIFTARSNHLLGSAPFFVYDGIYVDGYPFSTVSDKGKYLPEFALVSTRAAFGMWVLWSNSYTDDLLALIANLYDPQKGWFEGRYERNGEIEKTITLATNSMVLQTLLFKVKGKLYVPSSDESFYKILLKNEFQRPGKCFPEVTQ